MLTTVLIVVLYAALVIHIILMGVALWRVWRGENIVDRLIGADLITTITLAILVILAVIDRNSIYIDAALGLAALGFIGTIALAKYIADEQMF
ncbi:MAG: monovalent cation/H+ antiporter complex subunit F [Thiolinea sp.]